MAIVASTNTKFISGPATYVLEDSIGIVNCDTTLGAITVILPNIQSSGILGNGRIIRINDYSGTAATNNIIITAAANLVNGASSIVINTNLGSAQIAPQSLTEWQANLGNDSQSSGPSEATVPQMNAGTLGGVYASPTNMDGSKYAVRSKNVGDANYSIAATDKILLINIAFTAARTFTLPAANSVPAGYEIIVADAVGAITSTNTLTVTTSGSDTIDGASSAVISASYRMIRLFCDGVSKWTYDSLSNLFPATSSEVTTGADSTKYIVPSALESSKYRIKQTQIADVNYNILATDKYVATKNAFTAARTWNLPAASSVPAGYEIIVADAVGAVSSTNTLTVARSGSDTIDGATSVSIATAYGMRRFFSDGVSTWTYDNGVVRRSANLSDLASAATSRTNLGLGTAAVQDATYFLQVANNLSDLASYLTARNNLGIYLLNVTGDQTTTLNTGTNITGLSLSMPANSKWIAIGGFRVGCNNTGGVTFAVTTPAGASFASSMIGATSSGTAFQNASNTASGTLNGLFNTQNVQGRAVLVFATIENGANAGNLQWQIASGVSTQTSTIYQIGSGLLLIRTA